MYVCVCVCLCVCVCVCACVWQYVKLSCCVTAMAYFYDRAVHGTLAVVTTTSALNTVIDAMQVLLLL